MALKIQIEVFCVVSPCKVKVAASIFRVKLIHINFLPQHYTASQTRRPLLQVCRKNICRQSPEFNGTI